MDRRIFLALLGASGMAWNADATDLKSLIEKATAKGGSGSDADGALRETLTDGTLSAVTRVSKPDGYWGDSAIRIPLPKALAGVQAIAKPLGMSGALDDVHLRMNRAAEAAAPLARDLFLDAIRGMTIKDAVGIIKGGPTSGTEYLQKTTTPRLTSAFTPPMEDALQSTGCVQSLDAAVKRNKLGGIVHGDAKTYLSKYAVGLALNGLFHYIGVEETSIRHDPGKTGSNLLKRVFG
ncbi:DUF4197 domain-containing protein [Asticcacaulis solisilvae]|uniref:DUF4197 domain-containing protein n=1 Tax=Asticcacaulis solisilvae TaxID=1217274 RepID=UPI003FD81441